VVNFHSGLQTQRPAEPGKVTTKILVNTGADDAMVPLEAVKAFEDEMTKAGADWEVISYSNAKHSFTNPDAASVGMPAATRLQQTNRPTSVHGKR
jgi:dienelactone hydrolase